MTALTSRTARNFEKADAIEHPVAPGTIVLGGAALSIGSSSPYVRSLQAGETFAGFAVDTANNVAGRDPIVQVIPRGSIRLDVTGVVASSFGASVYATDDNTFNLTGGVYVGKVAKYIADGQAIVSYSVSGDGISPTPGISTYNATALAAWRRARSKALEPSARPAVVSVVGDSITLGVTSGTTADATTAASAWVERVSAVVNARLGIATRPQVYNAHDTRLTLAGGAAQGTSVGLIGRNVALQGAGHTLTTPSFSFTSLEAWYFESNGTGTPADPDTGVFSVNIDAAGATSMTDAGAFRTYKAYAPADVAAGAHTAVLERVSGNNYIVGLMGYTKSANGSGVAFHRCGFSGAAAIDTISGGGVTAALTGAAPARITAAWGAQGSPDLIIIGFAHNDATYYTPAQYGAYLDTILAQIGTSIPVLLLAPPFPPSSQDSGAFGARQDYWEQMRQRATGNVCHARIGEVYGTRALGDSAGLYYDGTTVHPSNRGYAAIADAVSALLLS